MKDDDPFIEAGSEVARILGPEATERANKTAKENDDAMARQLLRGVPAAPDKDEGR